MKTFTIKFEQLNYGSICAATVTASSFLHAVVKAARECGIRAQWRGSWHFWHTQTLDGKPSCFRIA